jgi:hypothetical protein
MTEAKMFPVLWQGDRVYRAALTTLHCPRAVPWGMIEIRADACRRIHDQTPQRLVERGGLSPEEILALDEPTWEERMKVLRLPPSESVPKLWSLVRRWENTHQGENPLKWASFWEAEKPYPTFMNRDEAEALGFLLTRIGSWTSARWDQHLRHEVGDAIADKAIEAICRRTGLPCPLPCDLAIGKGLRCGRIEADHEFDPPDGGCAVYTRRGERFRP